MQYTHCGIAIPFAEKKPHTTPTSKTLMSTKLEPRTWRVCGTAPLSSTCKGRGVGDSVSKKQSSILVKYHFEYGSDEGSTLVQHLQGLGETAHGKRRQTVYSLECTMTESVLSET